MRVYGWRSELMRLLLAVLVVLALGVLLGLGAWLAVALLLGYSIWSLSRLRDLNRWLLYQNQKEPPEASGLWGSAFDLIFQLQKSQERSQEQLQSAIDYLHDGLGSLDDAAVMLEPDGAIQWANESAKRLLGIREKQDVGRPLLNLVRTPEFIRYFEKEDYRERLRMLSPVNASRHLAISIAFFGQRNRIVIARDVTNNFNIENMRKEFVANASHELRTPLTVVNGYLEALADGGLDERWQRPLKQMQQQTRRMHNLVQDLLALSRLESLPVSDGATALDVCAEMSMLREEILAAADGAREVVIECDCQDKLLGSDTELRSAFSNLAINATRYTKDGDTIILRWYTEKDSACFEVEDTGIGIEPQHIPRLTERFYRVDSSRSKETGGTGLGLAIVKHVLMRHNASLLVSSQPDRGSVFCCCFPLENLQVRAA